jgi:hypothetical protein
VYVIVCSLLTVVTDSAKRMLSASMSIQFVVFFLKNEEAKRNSNILRNLFIYFMLHDQLLVIIYFKQTFLI